MTVRKGVLRRALCLFSVLLMLLILAVPLCSAESFSSMPNFGVLTENGLEYKNSSTGYRVVILDEIDLLTASEERQLLDDMMPLTEYGSVAFWSTREDASDELEQARLKRRELFELSSGSIFVINMNLRKVTIQSYGAMYDVITSSRANSITNNVRNYLTRGEYYAASRMAFSQMNSLMHGNRIAQPMKILSNACIALMVGLMLMLQRVFRYASTFRKPSVPQIVGATALAFTAGAAVCTGSKKRYSPRSSDSGGSSCSSCSSGGSSCSSCGGGGSSSF